MWYLIWLCVAAFAVYVGVKSAERQV